jgi:hypothetical protein
MPAMALTQADLDALDRAIASSELEVEQDGKRVRFASFDDLLKRRVYVANALTSSASTRSASVFRYTFTTSRGD